MLRRTACEMRHRRLLVSVLCALFVCLLIGAAATQGFFGDNRKILLPGPVVDQTIPYPKGRILLLGGSRSGGYSLRRLRVSGSRDRSFGGDGNISLNEAVPGLTEVVDVAVSRDRKIVLAGSREVTDGGSDVVVIRLRRDGGLDRSFGNRGVQVVDFGRRLEWASSVAVAPAGEIIVAGRSATTTYSRAGDDGVPVVARRHPEGAPDRTFGDGGALTLTRALSVADLAFQPSGKILVAVIGGIGLDILRLEADGSPDLTFGQAGRIEGGLPGFGLDAGQPYFSPVEQIAVTARGKVLIAGTASDYDADGANYSTVAARYTVNGKLDPSFGSGGVARAKVRGSLFADAFAVQPGGRLVVTGSTREPEPPQGDSHFGAVCFRPDGRLDHRFGRAGKAKVGFGGNDWSTGVVFQPHRRIVLVGYSVPREESRLGTRVALVQLRLHKAVR